LFSSLKQIDAGVLNVGYAEAGPVGGPPVILLHGWPYDIYSFVDVAPLLASAGYRVTAGSNPGDGLLEGPLTPALQGAQRPAPNDSRKGSNSRALTALLESWVNDSRD
jgi:pimeloyl-ACP methyl ester carboxylesterase